ncbi:hypothetical protein COB55_05990 [Candidatus Wolfebacteria bacterium]|nr:MAG: hypothetical protein COB55_05990 [Candidatus Wolfebacteria bacterium]
MKNNLIYKLPPTTPHYIRVIKYIIYPIRFIRGYVCLKTPPFFVKSTWFPNGKILTHEHVIYRKLFKYKP